MIKSWSDEAWEDYLYWSSTDKDIFKKINELIKDIERNRFKGLGKPEPLRHTLSGYWSRHITQKERIIYKIEEQTIYILSCRGHYED